MREGARLFVGLPPCHLAMALPVMRAWSQAMQLGNLVP